MCTRKIWNKFNYLILNHLLQWCPPDVNPHGLNVNLCLKNDCPMPCGKKWWQWWVCCVIVHLFDHLIVHPNVRLSRSFRLLSLKLLIGVLYIGSVNWPKWPWGAISVLLYFSDFPCNVGSWFVGWFPSIISLANHHSCIVSILQVATHLSDPQIR